ncbi:glycosyltransferase [Candidatus Collierbacteria bacterium]|nr:glycosyltransferase [Candidatus Collierbacteria bacterium]
MKNKKQRTKNKEQKTFLLTGTHITPAVALTQEIFSRFPGVRVVYIGRKKNKNGEKSVEKEEITRIGAEFIPISFAKLNRFISISILTEFLKIPGGLIRGLTLVKRIKPDVVVSFGGYTSIPIILAAKISGVPIIVHEQTLVWGLANRIARGLADYSAISWAKTADKKSVLTGNPIPEEIILAKNKKIQPNILFITGGSQGSQTINRLVEPILPVLTKYFFVYHQTGSLDSHSASWRSGMTESRKMKNYVSAEWFPTPIVAEIFQKSKIVVSRSGANTITYLSYFGIPSILIPLPISGGGEQSVNANLLAETGLATVLNQDGLTSEKLLEEILRINKNYDRIWKSGAENAGRLIISDSAAKLLDLVAKVL